MKTFKSILLNMIKDPRENTNQWMNSIPALERKASNMDTKVNNVEEKSSKENCIWRKTKQKYCKWIAQWTKSKYSESIIKRLGQARKGYQEQRTRLLRHHLQTLKEGKWAGPQSPVTWSSEDTKPVTLWSRRKIWDEHSVLWDTENLFKEFVPYNFPNLKKRKEMKQTSKYKMHLEHQIGLIREEMLNTVRDYIKLIA